MSGDLGGYTAEGLSTLAHAVFAKPFRLEDLVAVLGNLAAGADRSSYILQNN